MDTPYRVCVACVTFGLSHARAWRRLEPRVQLVAIADKDEAKRQKLLASPGNEVLGDRSPLRIYDDAVDMMDKEQPDIASIAVAPALNPTLVPAAAERGIHVVCEKPMATTLEDADRMLVACREAGVRAAREAFLDWIEAKDANVATGEDGRAALEMALAAYESNRLGGTRVTFPTRIQGNPLVRTFQECPGALMDAVSDW